MRARLASRRNAASVLHQTYLERRRASPVRLETQPRERSEPEEAAATAALTRQALWRNTLSEIKETAVDEDLGPMNTPRTSQDVAEHYIACDVQVLH